MVNLHDVAGKGDLEAIRKFLKHSPSKVDKTNREGQTALHCAAKGGHVEVSRHLIEVGADANAEDGKIRTPMWIAVDSNRAGVVQLLCEAGADTSRAGPEGRTPLHIAARKGFVECAELLLKHRAPLDGNPDKWGKTPGDDCVTSDIRILIDATRRERAAEVPRYTPQVPTAPPLTDGYAAEVGGAQGAWSEAGAWGEVGTWSEAGATPLPFNPTESPPYNLTEMSSQFNPAEGSPYGPAGTSSPFNPAEGSPYNPAGMSPPFNPAEGSPYNPAGMSPPFNPAEGSLYHPTGKSSPSNQTASDHFQSNREVVPSAEFSTPGKGVPRVSLTPASKQRQAAKVGGSRCAACFAPERSRQLAPCNHVVCVACARRARNEGENICPICRERIFDDNPLLTPPP